MPTFPDGTAPCVSQQTPASPRCFRETLEQRPSPAAGWRAGPLGSPPELGGGYSGGGRGTGCSLWWSVLSGCSSDWLEGIENRCVKTSLGTISTLTPIKVSEMCEDINYMYCMNNINHQQ